MNNQEGFMLNQDQIKGKWDEIKGGVRNLWGKLTDDEVEQFKGNLQSISGIVQERYGESKDSISKKLDRLMDSFDNETDKSLKLNDGESSYERNPTGIRTMEESEYEDEEADIKTRSPERSTFEQSTGGAINSKQGIAGNKDNQPYPGGAGPDISLGAGAAGTEKSDLSDVDDVEYDLSNYDEDEEYDDVEIFEEEEKEDIYQSKKPGPDSEDRIARH